jgi:hypothetical protein
MAKRNQKSRSVSEIVVWIISILVVLSMAVGFVLSVLPQPEPVTPEPNVVIVTVQPDDTQVIIEGGNAAPLPELTPSPIPTAGS